MGDYRFLTTVELRKMQSMEGSTAREIAEEICRPQDAVRTWCKQYGINLKKARFALFAEDVAQIMELKESGMTYSEIAKHRKMPSGTIRSAICRAKKYGMDAYPSRHMTELVASL